MNTAPHSQSRIPRALRLKQSTKDAHEVLDRRIMAGQPFRDREHYARFVAVQYYFHRDIDPLYAHEALRAAVPDLRQRRRLELIEQDLRDLEIDTPSDVPRMHFVTPFDMPAMLGWLYVSEGSNLGAALLSKEPRKLGLGPTFGARHLAAPPDGRGSHWQRFIMSIDALELTEDDDLRMIDGAQAAFGRVQGIVETVFALASHAAHS